MRQGFSIIEILLVLALTAILLIGTLHVGHTWYQQLLLSQHLSTWIQTLRLARTYALVTGQTTTICPSTTDLQCASDNHYETGWLVFAENSAGIDGQLDADDRLISVNSGWPQRLTLRTNFTQAIHFNPEGRLPGNGRFIVCRDHQRAHAVGIFVTRSGRLRTVQNEEIAQCLSN